MNPRRDCYSICLQGAAGWKFASVRDPSWQEGRIEYFGGGWSPVSDPFTMWKEGPPHAHLQVDEESQAESWRRQFVERERDYEESEEYRSMLGRVQTASPPKPVEPEAQRCSYARCDELAAIAMLGGPKLCHRHAKKNRWGVRAVSEFGFRKLLDSDNSSSGLCDGCGIGLPSFDDFLCQRCALDPTK